MLAQFYSPSWLHSGVNIGASTTEYLCEITNNESYAADINVMDIDDWSLYLTQNCSHNNLHDSCQVHEENFNT